MVSSVTATFVAFVAVVEDVALPMRDAVIDEKVPEPVHVKDGVVIDTVALMFGKTSWFVVQLYDNPEFDRKAYEAFVAAVTPVKNKTSLVSELTLTFKALLQLAVNT